MESDFVTRQHVESLTPHSDPSLAEVLNNYKFPPKNPPQPQQPPQMGGYQMPFFGGAPTSNNDMLLGNILGQMQASLQNNQKGQLDGIFINVNILKWLLLIILLAILIWLALKVQKENQSPLTRRLKKIEKEMKRMRRFKRKKNPKSLPLEADIDDIDNIDDEDDLGDF